MTRRVDALIVGAGIVGLLTAMRLAERGAGRIEVVDAAPSLLLGASGRNGGGVRAQWTTVENIELARRSIRAFERLAALTGHNTWFRQGGYLFVVRDEATLSAVQKAAAFQNAHGVRTRVLTPEQARQIVPGLSLEGVVGASFNPDDGTLFPWPVVHGVAERCRKLGVEIRLGAAVSGLNPSGEGPVSCEVAGQSVQAQHVVVAAGARTRELVAPLGVELPTRPERHEILVTEALKPFLDPMVVDLSNGLYASQAMRGELVGGLGRPHHQGHSWESTFEFSAYFANALVRLLPRLGGVNVLRQWAGSYDATPDARPILGRIGPWQNLLVACGFSGHGFMLSPSVADMLVEMMLDGSTQLPTEPFSLERFSSGQPLEQEALVIG